MKTITIEILDSTTTLELLCSEIESVLRLDPNDSEDADDYSTRITVAMRGGARHSFRCIEADLDREDARAFEVFGRDLRAAWKNGGHAAAPGEASYSEESKP